MKLTRVLVERIARTPGERMGYEPDLADDWLALSDEVAELKETLDNVAAFIEYPDHIGPEALEQLRSLIPARAALLPSTEPA